MSEEIIQNLLQFEAIFITVAIVGMARRAGMQEREFNAKEAILFAGGLLVICAIYLVSDEANSVTFLSAGIMGFIGHIMFYVGLVKSFQIPQQADLD